MSRFDERAALSIIAASRKRSDDGELLGEPVLSASMAENLLAVLQWFEDDLEYAISAGERDLLRDTRLKITSSQRAFVRTAIDLSLKWDRLEPTEKWNLVWAAEPLEGDVNRWTDRPTHEIDAKVQQIENSIALIVSLNERDMRARPGRRRGRSQSGSVTLPLRTFVKVLKAWWEQSTEHHFGQMFLDPVVEGDEPMPISPAANFVCAAVSYLQLSYSMTEIRTVMREFQAEPQDGV